MMWLEFGSFKFDAETRILSKDGLQVALSPKAADLLLLFLHDPAKLFSKDELKRMLWPDLAIVEDGNLFFQMSCLREALGENTNGKGFIENLPKRGYRFVVPVQKRGTDDKTLASNGAAVEPSSPDVRTGEPAILREPWSRPSWFLAHRLTVYSVVGLSAILAIATMLALGFAPEQRVWVAECVPLTHDGFFKVDESLLSDGVRVYFQETSPNGLTLANVAVSGGDSGRIPAPKGFEAVYDLSPLTSEVLASPSYSEQGEPLWEVSLIGGPPKRIGDLYAKDAKWSPDKRQIVFTLRQELHVANVDGSQNRRIAKLSGIASLPRWSPDGMTIRFTEIALDNSWRSIWEIRADGTNLQRLLPGWSDPPQECCGVWTPDGSFYIFQSMREGRRDLWALSERRGFLQRERRSPIRLTSGMQSYSSPAPGNQGTQLFAIGQETRGELVRYDSNLKEFAPYLGGIAATWVTFSNSGRSVAYISYPDLTVWRANPDGSGKTQITFAPFEANGLSWSPDDRWLAFRGRTAGNPWKIYLTPSSGGKPESLIPGQTEQAIPTWSPDGTRIAFGDVPPIHGKATGTETIHILDLKNHTVSDLPGSQGLWTARWSPDGRFLSAMAIEGGRLMLYDFKTKKWRSTQATTINNPTWSRDSKYIYYDLEGTIKALRRVSAADGHVDDLVRLDGFPLLSWWWSGVAPATSPLVLRNLGTSEIYSLTLATR